ncbi:hypothetical protein Q8791_30455 [Nocardiopsis sp. CT-R113]|uniref:Uncharacterized protein n=1 Tax=Nocardiopsis codii TaxID=3065942 RepID=A0ABU7KH65_9ACTN|nr:hypothetical protein [Nocardiopsis sp. CT-R113]MEE2041552.1 hypothetical protein [Nocardiopsis sp. CT-R113]
MSPKQPRVSTRAKYKLKFSPYLWVRDLDIATPILHTITGVIANAVDPDGGFCWLTNKNIGQKACYSSQSAAKNAVNTLCEFGVARKLEGQLRLDVLAAAGVVISPDETLAVIELLIPASAYTPEDLVRVNLMRAERGLGLDPITPETRPDITGLIGTRAKRKDAGKEAPQRRAKDRRAAEAAYQEEQPSRSSAQDLEGPPEDPFEAPPLSEGGTSLSEPGTSDPGEGQNPPPPGFQKPTPLGFRNPPPWVSETPNPYMHYPRDADPDSSPSVGAQPQEEFSQVSGPDGPDGQGSAQQDDDQGVNGAGGDAARPADDPGPAPAEPVESPAPPTAAELLVDQLLSETARLGAEPLGDPVQDRRRLVAMAQAALDRGMTPMRLREIASAGLYNVKRQWALATRLSAPEAFAQGHGDGLGGAPMGGGAAAPRPRCLWHPNCTTLDARGRCAECAEAERVRSLAAGEVVEYSQDADGVWRDHTGAQAKDADEFEGLTPDEIAQIMADRARMSAELASRPERVREAAAAARRLFTPPADEELVDGGR